MSCGGKQERGNVVGEGSGFSKGLEGPLNRDRRETWTPMRRKDSNDRERSLNSMHAASETLGFKEF